MSRVFSSGPFVVDATLHTLAKHGERLVVTPKVFEALVLLLRSRDGILTRDELSRGLWPGQVVTEANLNQHISMLRKALGDGAGGERYLLTLPGKGYQWVLPVEEREAAQKVVRRAAGWWVWTTGTAAVALVIAGGWWMVRRPEAGALRYSPVTRLQGSEFQPAISSDGRRVAFVWDEEGRGGSQIYVMEQGSHDQRRASPGYGSCRSPAWSPDGTRLAYVCTNQDQAEVLISTPGGAAEAVGQLHPPAYGLSTRQLDWAPDGRSLVVVDKTEEGGPFSLYRITIETKERRRLTAPPADDVGDVEPRCSPDGRRIAFARQKIRFRHELMVMGAEGGAPELLNTENTEIGSLDWSGDGKNLYYSSNPQGEFRVWRISSRGGRAGRPEGTEIRGEHPIQIAVARQAAAVVYSLFRQDLDIWRLTLGAAPGKGENWERLIASTADDSMPQYSPDGSRICFRSNRSGEEQLWVSDGEGGNAVQVTRGSLWPTLGRWSPDGQRIVFNQYGSAISYIVWPDEPGRQPARLENMEHPSFSPEGKGIIHLFGGAVRSRVPEQGSPAVKVVEHARGGYPNAASPDGKFVYFTGGRTDPSVWRASLQTGKEEKVLDGLLPGCWACWALTDKGLYYISGSAATGADARLMFFDLASGRPRALADVPPPLAPLGTGALSASPDGRRFLVVRINRSNTDVVRLDGFR